MNAERTLVFTLCARVGFDVVKVSAALLALASGQYSMAYDSGGKVLQSSSVGGESFSFAVPASFDPTAMAELARSAYALVVDLTDAQLRTFALQTNPGGVVPVFNSLQTSV